MSDPLSVSAAIVGIVVPALHGTRLLIDDVKRITNAPYVIQRLQTDLDSTCLALESLRAIDETKWQLLGAAIAEQSKDAVKACESACDRFRSDLQRWTRRSRNGELSWRDRANVGFFKEKQIKAWSEHLQKCDSTLSSVVSMGTLYTAIRNNRMNEELQQRFSAIHAEISSVTRLTDSQITVVQSSLDQLNLDDDASLVADEVDDRNSAEAQLFEQRVALECSHKLFLELQSKLEGEKIGRAAAGGSGTASVSFGSITNGFGIGISNAPISNVTFGQPFKTE